MHVIYNIFVVFILLCNNFVRQCGGSALSCQSKKPVTFELELVSLKPRVFIISDFLSEFESQHIIELAKPKIAGSLVGNYDAGGARASETRTSENAWVLVIYF
jgi:hypothetical protein